MSIAKVIIQRPRKDVNDQSNTGDKLKKTRENGLNGSMLQHLGTSQLVFTCSKSAFDISEKSEIFSKLAIEIPEKHQ